MSSVETVSALGRRLNASIPQQVISEKVNSELKKIGRTAKVAGFRPGKVPAKILAQQYGAEARREALGQALQKSFAEAVAGSDLKIAGYPEFEVKTNDLNAEQIEYSATFEVYPEIVIGDLSGETIERTSCEFTQGDLETVISTLRKQRATYEAADRPAQAEDRVTIDFTGTLDGVVFSGGEAKDYPFVLGVGRMLPDFEAAITGMKAGESKSFDMRFPEDYHGKDVAGKQVTFAITVNKVEAPKLPELDSEFAKSVGIADGDISKLESEISSNLKREMASRVKRRNRDAATAVLLKVAGFEVPKYLVEYESHILRDRYSRDMQERGVKDVKSLPAELFAEQAKQRVTLGLMYADLVEKNDLKAKPEQIRAYVEEQAQSYEQPEEVVSWVYSDPNKLQEVDNIVVEENVTAWVFSKAQVVDKPVEFTKLMESM